MEVKPPKGHIGLDLIKALVQTVLISRANPVFLQGSKSTFLLGICRQVRFVLSIALFQDKVFLSTLSFLTVSEPCVQVVSWYGFHIASPGNCISLLFPSGVSELFYIS